MNHLATLIEMDFMRAVKEKVDAVYDEVKPSFEGEKLSKLIFRGQLDRKNIEVTHAHIQVIHDQLDRLYASDFLKTKAVLLEFSKSITLFERITNSLGIDGGCTVIIL